MCKNTYNDRLRMHSKMLIAQDGKILSEILLNVHNSAISLSLIPFLALYCRSAKEFLNVNDTQNEIEKEVMDIRNGLKIFTDKYSKGKNIVSESDNQQNEAFKNMLRFRITKELNIHLNLGVYISEEGKIVFNTQQANYYLNISTSKDEAAGVKARKVGEKLCGEIFEILVKYCDVNNFKEKTIFFNPIPKYGYIDINTNRKSEFFSKEFDKEINLRLLYMLSTIGFVNNLLVPIFPEPNVWLSRIVYITAHNTWFGIKKLSQHIEQNNPSGMKFNDLAKCIDENRSFFSSSFRNCMMHYDLVDKNDCPIILKEHYDPAKPLYGLVESCYSGMNFNQHYDKMYKLSQNLEEYLLSYFNVNIKKVHWDW